MSLLIFTILAADLRPISLDGRGRRRLLRLAIITMLVALVIALGAPRRSSDPGAAFSKIGAAVGSPQAATNR